MDNLLQVPLNWPDVRVLSTPRTEQGHWLIHVESRLEGTPGRCGGREIRDLHGVDAAVRLRHRPLFDVPVVREMGPNRSRGPYGSGHPTTPHRCAPTASSRPSRPACARDPSPCGVRSSARARRCLRGA